MAENGGQQKQEALKSVCGAFPVCYLVKMPKSEMERYLQGEKA